MAAFVTAVREQAESEAHTRSAIISRPGAYTAVVGEPERDEAAERDGRFGWIMPVNGKLPKILVPGVDLTPWRDMTASAPMITVNDSPWWWSTAVGQAVSLSERQSF